MISKEFEVTLHTAFVEARHKRHESITVEHLLLALLDNPDAVEALRACSAQIDGLRKALTDFLADIPQVAGVDEVDTQPTMGFQRVIQRAIMRVQSSAHGGAKEVTGADALEAIFGEKDSHAVHFLHQQGVTRLDVDNFVGHGISKIALFGDKTQDEADEAARPAAQKHQVVIFNDDYTPMDFVVGLLLVFFGKSQKTATRIMEKIHQEGESVCGVYPRDVAAIKVGQTLQAAREAGHPLQCVSEPVEE
jgi:ATP-dependent Clp protease adapter protein ClpS